MHELHMQCTLLWYLYVARNIYSVVVVVVLINNHNFYWVSNNTPCFTESVEERAEEGKILKIYNPNQVPCSAPSLPPLLPLPWRSVAHLTWWSYERCAPRGFERKDRFPNQSRKRCLKQRQGRRQLRIIYLHISHTNRTLPLTTLHSNYSSWNVPTTSLSV